MPSHKNPHGRRRRPSNTSSKSDQGKNPKPKRGTNSPAPHWKSDSTDSGKRGTRSGASKRNFGSSGTPHTGGQQKPSDERRTKSSGGAFQNSLPDRKSRTPRGPRKEKAPFKARGEEFSSGLRRERPYKKSAGPSQSFNDGKTFVKKEGRAKRPVGHENVQPDLKAPTQTGKIRLNRFIANSGVCSRREADELIKMGLISVNGKVITEMGYKVDPGDEVRHESKVLRAERPVYILLNKPKGFLTTTSDPQERNTVMHLIGNKVKERVYPVGRLDRNTTGLLLLTNDGELADKLMHPSYNVKKIYKVELDKPLTKGDAQLILEGVQLEEGKAMVDDLAIISDDKRTVGLEIHIGWNRVVRRIFEALSYEVIKLDRSVYAGLDKKNLGRGEWRFLSKEELVRLKHF
jgi:23S rRNA pseudouridine2605 synthase